MTKEQAQSEYLKLLNKHIDEEKRIMEDAKKKGIWDSGLDSNRELFKKSNEEFMKKVELIKSMVDE